MSLKIYVGNYPTDFTLEDITNLFNDFHGVRYMNSIKKDKKCYSFFVCDDENQVVEVVTSMNNAYVCGRNLIVRSTDNDLQNFIQSSLRPCDSSTMPDVHECASNSSAASNLTRNEHFSRMKYENRFEVSDYIEEKDISHQALPLPDTASPNLTINERFSRLKYENKIEVSDYIKEEDISHQALPLPDTADIFCRDKSLGEFGFISVTNFPIGTSERDLFHLFADYNAIEVLIKCNEARRDRTLTEAIICFASQEDATNAILNLDNTVYRRRVILVNDVKDLSVTMELLAVGGKS